MKRHVENEVNETFTTNFEVEHGFEDPEVVPNPGKKLCYLNGVYCEVTHYQPPTNGIGIP